MADPDRLSPRPRHLRVATANGRPKETAKAKDVLYKGQPLDKAIDQIAYDEFRDLSEDPAFRLQMVFQAILAHDDHVANALRHIDKTNFET